MTFDSYTNEEAVLTPIAAINQRSRWVKGYAQTSLVLLRRPLHNMLAFGPFRYWVFLLQVGGAFLSLLLAPITWVVTVTYFATDSRLIQELFPLPLFYTGILLLIGGNIGLLAVGINASFRSAQYETVRYLLTMTPLWWILLSAAAYLALLELVFPKWRPSWNKTAHGVRYMTRRRRLWFRFCKLVNGEEDIRSSSIQKRMT